MRTLAIADRAAIEEQMYKYATYADLNSPRDLAGLFTEDCRVNYLRGDDGWLHGREAVAELFGSALARYAATSHTISNIELELKDDARVIARSRVQTWHQFTADRPDYVALGEFEDIWTLVGPEWLISQRRFRVAVTTGLSAAENAAFERFVR